MNVDLTAEVRDVLKKATVCGNVIKLPPARLDRKLYEAVNKALVAAGGKWDRKAGGHVVGCGDPAALLAEMLETGVAVDVKKERQAFYTPRAIARVLVDAAGVRGKRVLEPSAGEGALALVILEDQPSRLDCVELDKHAAAKCGEIPGVTVEVGDFLAVKGRPVYDRVVMNPPFAKNADMVHVSHAVKFLVPGGRLVAVMLAAENSRRKLGEFVDGLARAGFTVTEELLPDGAFLDSGTRVDTKMLVVDRV